MQNRLFALTNKTNTLKLSSSIRWIDRHLTTWQQPKSFLSTQIKAPTTLPMQAIKPSSSIIAHTSNLPLCNTPIRQLELNAWQLNAIRLLQDEQRSCPETPIYFLCAIDGVDIFAKDERKQPTGSHKHRLTRSLFLHALGKGIIHENSSIIEASSEGAACSEAYFAKLLQIPYTAVVCKGTPQSRLDAITAKNGSIVECELGQDKIVAAKLGAQANWHSLNQFANTVLVTDKENNIASELTQQFKRYHMVLPRYIACSADTGAILGSYFQEQGFHQTEVIVGDTENSASTITFKSGDMTAATGLNSRIGGMTRPRIQPAFDLNKIKEVMPIPDAASIAAAHFLKNVFDLHSGVSTGANLFMCFELIERMRRNKQKGSVLMLICDEGHLYNDTYYNRDWLKAQKLNIFPYLHQMYDIFGNYSDKKITPTKQSTIRLGSTQHFQSIATHEVVLFNERQSINKQIDPDLSLDRTQSCRPY